MSGRKRKPCEFCDGEYEGETRENRNGYYIWLEVYPFNNIMAFMAQANDENGELIEDYIQVQMNYCPICGRKLID